VNPDASGAYVIEIEAGTYEVTSSLAGYQSQTIEDVEVFEGQASTGIDFTLEATVGPGWSVNPAAYEFNGSVNAGVFDSGVQIGAVEDSIAAFSNGECRGTVYGLYFPPEDEVVFMLMVYSNETSGDMLTFKYWDASEDEIYDIPNNTVEFIPNMIVGQYDPYEPYVLDISGGPDLGTIEGTVTLEGGTGNVEDVEVTADDETVNPDASGAYVIEIEAGTYEVTSSLAGYTDSTITDVEVVAGQATTGVDFTLTSTSSTFPVPPSNVTVPSMVPVSGMKASVKSTPEVASPATTSTSVIVESVYPAKLDVTS